jgi:tetratricopeptide (TPR) repeat protein
MTTGLPATLPQVAAVVLDLLSQQRCLDWDELLDGLERSRLDLGDDPEDLLDEVLGSEHLPLVMPIGVDRWADLPALLAGHVATHRVTAAEAGADLLVSVPDLEHVSVLMSDERYQRLTDGTPARADTRVIDGEEVWGIALEPGTLKRLGIGADDLVAVRATESGLVLDRIEASDLADPPEALGPLIEETLEDRDGEPQLVELLWWQLVAELPSGLADPIPPISEVLDSLGFARHGAQVAMAGFDFARHGVDRRIESIRQIHRIDEDQALAVVVLGELHARLRDLTETVLADEDADPETAGSAESVDPYPGEDAGDAEPSAPTEDEGDALGGEVVAELLDQLEDPAVAEALLAEAVGVGTEGAIALGVLAESLETRAPKGAKPSLRWLQAKAVERLGNPEEAEGLLREVLTMEPGHGPALYDLARYASDRGDAEAGLSLLRRAGAPADDGLVQLLEHFRPRARADLGRNERCWCGSGRKYKQCHLGKEVAPLADRAAWLYQKAGTYLHDGPWRLEVMALAQVRARDWEHEWALLDALDDPLVADVALFEGGGFAAFLAERGHLLPDDERLLAEQWLLVERSVFEIEGVEPGATLTVRDVRTGDRHVVRERTASRQLQPGVLCCARIVPAGDTMQIFGGLEPVALHQRDRLIALLDADPDPEEVVAELSARFGPPVLQNTEGDPLVFCEAEVRVPDADGLRRWLDAAYDRSEDEDDAEVWLEHVVTHGLTRVRATLRLVGDRLHIDVNSEARLDRLLDAVRSEQPGAEVASEQRVPATDLQEVQRLRPPTASLSSSLDPADPAIAQALEEMVRQHEAAWLDEQIPALGGVTPRQAAADPTRRPDLERLLAGFDGLEEVPGAMSARRLRDALGLR